MNNSIESFNILGVKVHPVDMDGAIAAFEEIVQSEDRKVYISALGVAGVMEAHRNDRMRRILNRSYLNTADGMPLVWIGKMLGHQGIDRVYGPDLMRNVCCYSADKNWSHFFYGGGPGLGMALEQRMKAKFPGINIAGRYTPPFRDLNAEEEEELIDKIRDLKPDILWIGISTPRQLYFMEEFLPQLDVKIVCAVGYAFDVNAGLKEEAPAWMMKTGLQWLHRALTDPRLWRRYLRDNPLFVWLVLLQLLRLKKFPVEE